MSLGVVYVVSTPIGHPGDMGARALEVLRQVDWVAAEDTRRTRALLAHFGIEKPLVACHAHNESRIAARVIEAARMGESVALVSDAGTPCLSDPGQAVVGACHDAGVRVVPIPGASAITAALSVAGLHNSRFVFEGFVPREGRARRDAIRSWRDSPYAVVLFEAANRALATLDELVDALGAARAACIARELTKVHEQIVRGTLSSLRDAVKDGHIPSLGEFVLVIEGVPRVESEARPLFAVDDVLRACLEALPASKASRLAARITGQPRARLYARAIELGAAADDAPADSGVGQHPTA